MDYSTFEHPREQITLPDGMEALSVYRTLEQVSDGRHKRGVRYSVALVLTLILLAKFAGMTTPLAIAEWVRLRADWLHTVLPTRGKTFPCAATYSKVLRAVDAEQVIPIRVLRDHSKMREVGQRTETLRIGFKLIKSFTHLVNYVIKRGKSEIRQLFFT